MLGYSSVEKQVSAPAADLTLELTPVALKLEGITAVARPAVTCPRREDHAARELWAALRVRYDHTQDTLGLSFYATRYDATGPLDDLGSLGERQMMRSWYGVAGRSRRLNAHYTSSYTYAYPILTSFDPAYARWRYRELQTTDVGHFIDEEFGERHTFSVLGQDKEVVILGFCPTEGRSKRATIEGKLTVGRDTSLVKAEWTFRTPRPTEEAGGEVVFVPRGPEAIPLLPARALFWRKLIGRRISYFQRSEQFATYEFLPPDSAPARPLQWLTNP
jgi:hypothetical protein